MSAGTAAEPTYRVRPDRLAWRRTGREAVLLDLGTSVYFGLNPTATTLWQALVEGATRTELVGLLTAAGAGERATADVDGFLADLRADDLLDP